MTQESEWVEQYRGELEKQCSARAAQVESLLFVGDFEAIIDWLNQWQQEDERPNSLRKCYRRAVSESRQAAWKARMKSYGKTLNKLMRASADELETPSAD
jgi:fructose-bisphosphate aldolase class 1